MNEKETDVPHCRRVRYNGTHPRRFDEKYKELQPEKYELEIAKVIASGHTPAGTHRAICVDEILSLLHPAPGETGLDATLGYGGHSQELLRLIQPGERLFATDVDPIELPKTTARLNTLGFGPDVFFPRLMNYAGAAKLLPETGGRGFDFLLADLGVSSMQLDNPRRGFTFKNGGPLDLRLNPQRGKPVWRMIREDWSEEKIEKFLVLNADEPHATLLAEAIYVNREHIRSTTDLADTVRDALSAYLRGDVNLTISKALPRVFQAFRIAVNGEFTALEQFLNMLPFLMAPGGRIAVLTFHSGEDDRVRRAFADGLTQGVYAEAPETPIRPSAKEMFSNSRSKSARLRFAKVSGDAKQPE